MVDLHHSPGQSQLLLVKVEAGVKELLPTVIASVDDRPDPGSALVALHIKLVFGVLGTSLGRPSGTSGT